MYVSFVAGLLERSQTEENVQRQDEFAPGKCLFDCQGDEYFLFINIVIKNYAY